MGIFFYIAIVVGLYNIFEKAGVSGWKAIIPIYSSYHLVKIINRSTTFFWLMVTPITLLFLSVSAWGLLGFMSAVLGSEDEMGVIAQMVHAGTYIFPVIITILVPATLFISIPLKIVAQYDLAKSFGKGVGTMFGLIFLPFVFTLILGFDESKYTKITRTHKE